MNNLKLIIKSLFLSIVNLFLLLLGSILMFISALLNQLYIPLIAAIPIIAIGLITSGFGSILITGIIIIVSLLILSILMAIINILISISKTISTAVFKPSEHIFIAYYRLSDIIDSDTSLVILFCKLPKPIAYIFISPCYVVIGIYYIIIYINKLLFIPAIISSVGIACYSFYSYKVNFKEPIVATLIDTLSYFSTHTTWGNLSSAIIILLAVIVLLIKISFDLKLSAECIYLCQTNKSSAN